MEDKILYIKPKETVEKIESYNVPLFEPLDCEYKLDSNENIYGPSQKVIEYLKNLNIKDICHYPFYGETVNSFAKFYNVNNNEILLTNGADEAISVVFNTYLTSKDAVLTVSPTFSMPRIYSQIIGANFIQIPYKEKWNFPLDDFLDELKTNEHIKIVHLTTPNNPTGDIISKEIMNTILNNSSDKLVVIDETYANYCNTSYIELINDYKNVVIIKSMSKDFALAGLRLGVIFTCKENIINLKKVISPYSVNMLAAKAASCALSDVEYFKEVRNNIDSAKNDLYNYLKSQGFKPYKSYANFILCDFGSKADFVYQKLKNSKILVKKFENSPLKNHLRITIPNNLGNNIIKEQIKPKPVIVFDMDGVLIDVSNSYKTAIKQTYKYFTQLELSDEEIILAKNTGKLNNDWDLSEYLILKAGINIEKAKIIEKFQQIYWDKGNGVINNETLIIDPVILEELSKKYHIALFTGRPKVEAYHSLSHFKIEKYFDYKITMDDLPPDKQKPDILGLTKIYNSVMFKDKLYYIGDSVADIICAKKFNQKYNYILTSIGVNTYNNEDVLNSYGADIIIKNTNEIIECLNDVIESRF